MSDEIKIVITHQDNKGLIGVQSEDCDPILRTFEGELAAGLEIVPGIVEEARQLWAETPQFPKCKSPLPSQAMPVQTAGAASAPKKTSRQQSMF